MVQLYFLAHSRRRIAAVNIAAVIVDAHCNYNSFNTTAKQRVGRVVNGLAT